MHKSFMIMALFAVFIVVSSLATLDMATPTTSTQLEKNMSGTLETTMTGGAITKAQTAATTDDDNNYYMARTANYGFESEVGDTFACTRPTASDVQAQIDFVIQTAMNATTTRPVFTKPEGGITVRTGIHARPASQIA